MAKPMPRRHQSAPKTLIRTRIKKDDTARVITGRDKGKTGRVLEVEGVMMVKRHTRPNPQRQIKGGIAERESSIHVSNVMIVTSEGKPTRVAVKMEGARKTRVATARRGGETLDKK